MDHTGGETERELLALIERHGDLPLRDYPQEDFLRLLELEHALGRRRVLFHAVMEEVRAEIERALPGVPVHVRDTWYGC